MLIVNADDFGLSEGVNRGIAEAHRRGVLTSTTAMANMPAFDHAVRLSREMPALGVGVHLNLTTGAPVLPPSRVATLVGKDGRFLRLGRLLKGLSLGRLDGRQIEEELGAQVERALGAGLSPTHLDSHHHMHTHPALQPMVVRIALRYGLPGIRCPVELSPGGALRGSLLLPKGEGGLLKAVAISLLGWLLRRRARRAGLAVPDHFRGLLLGPAFSSGDLHEVLRKLPAGSTELMCHPGYPDDELRQLDSYATGRDSELAALLDPATRNLLNGAGMRLGNYSDLSR